MDGEDLTSPALIAMFFCECLKKLLMNRRANNALLTTEQLSDMAALMGQPASKSAAAARLVLVEGLSSAEAARRVGITTQGANQAVQRCRRVIELARVVTGSMPTE